MRFLQGEKINKVIKASNNAVEGYWPGLFAKALEGQNVAALLTNVSGPSAGPASGAAAATAVVAEKVEEKVEEEEEEEVDMDMGGLFGDDY